MIIIVNVPTTLTIDERRIIELLINDVNLAIQSNEQNVNFDFTGCRFIAGEMTVLLGMLLREVNKFGKKYYLTNIPDPISKALTRNNFLTYFLGKQPITDSYNNTIKFYCDDAANDDQLNEYLDQQVFNNHHWADVTNGPQEKEKISTAIHELALNVSQHSNVNQVLCCGQYYPQMQKLSFAIGDNGISIPASVSRESFGTDSKLIDWATQRGTSTKHEPASGLGLYSVKNKLISSGGLTIISRNGYWSKAPNSQNGTVDMFDLQNSPLNGTFIHFSLDINEQETNNVSMDLPNIFF